MPFDFVGIGRKLDRTKENLLNLDGEINRFFEGGEYAVLPHHDKQLLLKAIEYHKRRAIPVRFSVLAGEIVHHLRSCFDHVVWMFSEESYRTSKYGKFIECPVVDTPPKREEDWFTRYDRKIKGVTDPGAAILINLLQPYHSSNLLDSLLGIIHRLDLQDKHRGLLMVGGTASHVWPMDVIKRYMSYHAGIPGALPVNLTEEFERQGKVQPQVSFKDFGGTGMLEPVVQGLAALFNFTVTTMRQFDALSRYRE